MSHIKTKIRIQTNTFPFKNSLSPLFKSFMLSTGGAFAIWAAVGMPVLVGGAALSVDVSRMYNLDEDLQSAADALSKAAAAELDQRPDSLTRAARAATTLVRNTQKFGDGGAGQVGISRIRYLKSLPSNDYDAILNSETTLVPSEARYVEVTVVPQSVSTMFPTKLVSSVTKVNLNARSVAGFDQGVCGVTPLFICNPYEGKQKDIYTAMEERGERRKQIILKTPGGKKAQHAPGNFGFVSVTGGNGGGANALKDAIARDISPVCMSKSQGIVLQPGNVSSVADAFNTRFDIYKGAFKNKKTDPAYAPAANVIKGWAVKGNSRKPANACRTAPNGSALGMPRDATHSANPRIGNGDWDFVEYMKVNHASASRLTINGTTYRFDYKRHTVTPTDIPTRYEMYRWEIEYNCVPGALTYGRYAVTPEEGLPQCHSHGPSTTVADRRVIQVAVLNCQWLEKQDVKMNGRSDPLPVETFVNVFLTEPMARGKNNAIYGEIVGPVISGTDAVARDKVALTR